MSKCLDSVLKQTEDDVVDFIKFFKHNSLSVGDLCLKILWSCSNCLCLSSLLSSSCQACLAQFGTKSQLDYHWRKIHQETFVCNRFDTDMVFKRGEDKKIHCTKCDWQTANVYNCTLLKPFQVYFYIFFVLAIVEFGIADESDS